MTAARELGFIGLGTMGSRMAARLIDGGEAPHVFDVDPRSMDGLVSRGAHPAPSAAALAERADIVLLSLPSGDIVLDVCSGPDGLLRNGKISTIVDLSTIGPRAAAELLKLTQAAGVAYVDAPVSGGPAGARSGSLTVMAAGSDEDIERVRPILSHFARTILTVSNVPGHGQLTKVINNLMSATAIAVTAEAVTLAAKNGLDPAAVLDAVNVSSGRNTASADKFPKHVLPRTFDFGFRLDLMTKDVELCLQHAAASGVPMLLGNAVEQIWETARHSLPEGSDCTAIVQVVERWAGIAVEP